MSETTQDEMIRVAWIPDIQEWRDVFECEHGRYYCFDPGDGLITHIEEGDGILVLETTEADCARVMNEFVKTLPPEPELEASR